ncbi:Fibronectin type III [Trinorchestia longiramus]|nr:Fibronectin type III [Trinorchestia longiramus]
MVHLQNKVSVAGRRSSVRYTPKTELDYGTLLCWGRNAVGRQAKPCVFHIFPAGPPDPVHNCSQFNLSATDVNVRCSPGFDGGLPQTFIMELYDEQTGRLVANVSSQAPVLWARSLPSSSSFSGVIFPLNSKGRGEIAAITAVTLRDQAEKRTAAMKPPPSLASSSLGPLTTPLIGVVLGVVLVVVLVVVAAVAIIKFRCDANRRCQATTVRIRSASASISDSPGTTKRRSLLDSDDLEKRTILETEAAAPDNNPDLIQQQMSVWHKGRFCSRGGSEEPLLVAPASPPNSTPASTLKHSRTAGANTDGASDYSRSAKGGRVVSSSTSSESFGAIIHHHHHQDPPPPAPPSRNLENKNLRNPSNSFDSNLRSLPDHSYASRTSLDDCHDAMYKTDDQGRYSGYGGSRHDAERGGAYRTLPSKRQLGGLGGENSWKSRVIDSEDSRGGECRDKFTNLPFESDSNALKTRCVGGQTRSEGDETETAKLVLGESTMGRSRRSNPMQDHLLKLGSDGERMRVPSKSHETEVVLPSIDRERESSV